ncbi:MAG TPA: hypothetical protein VJ919_16445, partial [Tangfeifania sp.]|nr:hypothetical protein [Tangfeifania sp.]
ENELEEELLSIAEEVWKRAEQKMIKAKTITLKFKYADFEQHTRSKTITGYFLTKEEFLNEGKKLMKSGNFNKGIRLLGLTLSNFQHEERKKPVQLTIEF